MNLKVIKFSFFVLFFIQLNAQIVSTKIECGIQVEYEIYYNTERPNTKNGTLYIDKSNQKSLFIYGKKEEKSFEQSLDEDTKFNVTLGGARKYNYTDFVADSLYSIDKPQNDKVIVVEKIPELKWTLLPETKKLNDFLLKKAKMNFRGRKYTAWYLEDYPLKFGPWKFNGLPGLIVEIYDETKRYHWIVKTITNCENKIIDLFSLFVRLKEIDLVEYVNLRYNSANKLLNKARLPRGSRVKSSKIPRNGIEIEFEWEKD